MSGYPRRTHTELRGQADRPARLWLAPTQCRSPFRRRVVDKTVTRYAPAAHRPTRASRGLAIDHYATRRHRRAVVVFEWACLLAVAAPCVPVHIASLLATAATMLPSRRKLI